MIKIISNMHIISSDGKKTFKPGDPVTEKDIGRDRYNRLLNNGDIGDPKKRPLPTNDKITIKELQKKNRELQGALEEAVKRIDALENKGKEGGGKK